MAKRIKKIYNPHDGVFYFNPPWNTRKSPYHANTKTPWCKIQAIQLDRSININRGNNNYLLYKEGKAIFPKIRCNDCGRLLQIMTVDIENGYGDFWPYIPPHKRKKLEIIKYNAHKRRKNKKKDKNYR